MNNTNWKILTIIGLGWMVLTAVGTFAATTTTTNEALNTKRPQMMKELGTWDFKGFKNPHVQMNNLLINLSDEDKETVESLLTEYREWEKLYFEGLNSATTDADKTALQEKWEASKTTLKEKLLKLVGEGNKEAVENIFSRNHKNELWWEKEGMPCAGGHNIVEKFIDTESLSETDKTEIKEIEEKKQEAVQSLQEKNQEAMKEINDEYFASIKKFVADDKLEEFENFVEEADNFEAKENWFGPWKWRMGGMRWDFNRENGQAPEFNNGERPEMPEMNGERPEFPQGQQMRR